MGSSPLKISGNQLFWLLMTTEISTTELVAFRAIISMSRQDAWISTICGGLIALVITVVIAKASLQFANLSIVAWINKRLGKWVTGIILVPYFLLGVVGIGLNLKQFMSFVHLELFNTTPQWVLVLIFFLVIIYVTHQGGIEGIARCAQLIGPCVIVTLILIEFLNISFMDIHRVLPLYHDSGLHNIFDGSVISLGFFGQTMVLFMLAPFLSKPERAQTSLVWAIVTATGLMTLSILSAILLFGSHLSARMLNPTFEFARFISSMEFIENVDSIVVVFWIAGYFVTFSMYLFIISHSVGEWMGWIKWKRVIWVVSLFIVTVSFWPTRFDITSVMMKYTDLFVVLILIHLFVIPALLWAIGRLYQGKGKGGWRAAKTKS